MSNTKAWRWDIFMGFMGITVSILIGVFSMLKGFQEIKGEIGRGISLNSYALLKTIEYARENSPITLDIWLEELARAKAKFEELGDY